MQTYELKYTVYMSLSYWMILDIEEPWLPVSCRNQAYAQGTWRTPIGAGLQ
jgi:hypothetical protein